MKTVLNRSCVGTAACAAVGLFVGAASAGDVTVNTVVKQGDAIPGQGDAGAPSDVDVNNDGTWLATVQVSNPSGRVILASDGVHMADGDVIDSATISSLANTHKSMNNNGDIVHRPSLAGDPDSAVVWNDDIVIFEDDVSTATGFSPGTPYIGFFRAKVNDANQMLLMASVNDPGLDGSVHRALVWVDYDPTDGTFTETVLAKKFDQLPGQSSGVLVNDFGTNSERWAINNNGDAMFTASLTGGDSATNAAIYYNDTVVAQKGDFGPFKDVTYNMGTSSTTRVDINDSGDYIMLMPLAGGPFDQNQALLRNNIFSDGPDEIIIRKGDPVPGNEDSVIDSFGTGAQPRLTEDGDVIWYASWDTEDGTVRGLFKNDELIIRTGAETADGDIVTNIAGTTSLSNGLGDGFQISDNGTYIVARAVLNDSTSERAVLLIELPDDACGEADLNCDGSVNVSDLLILLGDWGACAGCDSDLNDDDTVNVSDMLILLGLWG